MGTFNTYGYKSKKYGGAYPVWLTVSQKERSGGTLDPIPPVGTIIPAGTLVRLENAGSKAQIVKTFYVSEVDETNPENIKLRAYRQDFVPEVGMELAIPPKDLRGLSNEQISVSKIEQVEADLANQVYIVKLDMSISLKSGMILMEGDGYSTGIHRIKAIPTGITENDVWIEEGDEYATVASVYHGEIMEDRIQPIPDCIKSVLPMIKFTKGI